MTFREFLELDPDAAHLHALVTAASEMNDALIRGVRVDKLHHVAVDLRRAVADVLPEEPDDAGCMWCSDSCSACNR